MSDAWVINASPLILFARIARLDLFERLSPRIIVPNAVFEEVRAGQEKDTTAATALSWAAERRVPDATVPVGVAFLANRPEFVIKDCRATNTRYIDLTRLVSKAPAAGCGRPSTG